jgi:beta-galactosidase
MTVTNPSANIGLKIIADESFEANALHYTWRDLNAAYPYMLKPRKETVISVNYGSRGTGGASCGPGTLEKYKLYGGDYEYGFTLLPCGAADNGADGVR